MAMRSMRRFYCEIKGKKVKELPAYIKSTYSMESMKTYVMKDYLRRSSPSYLLWRHGFLLPLCYPPREMLFRGEEQLAKEESFPISRDDL
ncbi:BnaA01g06960D [Brassica napus]|uniref:BnaA01g06960D protein n=1 Tax=Brassica napus TaxID=3708 RepID=A0A078I389_BRANA|nr:BnaA01g06960D [Brassica napus]